MPVLTRFYGIVEEWRLLHQSELSEDWALAQARQPLQAIAPLE